MKTNILFLLFMMLPTISFAGDLGSLDKNNKLEDNYLSSLYGVARTICYQSLIRYQEKRQTLESVQDACTLIKDVVWDPNRDNSMSPITKDSSLIDQKIGKASALALGLDGTTAATQVCPGVYLSTAHGVLDNPLFC